MEATGERREPADQQRREPSGGEERRREGSAQVRSAQLSELGEEVVEAVHATHGQDPARALGQERFQDSEVEPAARRADHDVPEGWPAVMSNSRPLARPVYGPLVDEVAWEAADVLIGAAYRGAAPLNSHFILVRA